LITLEAIEAAGKRIADTVVKTPCAYAPTLSDASGAEVYLKKENLQVTGAFKLRGAFNKLALMDEAVRQRGVIAASAGNHAQGVAAAAKHFDTAAVIVMPEATPLTKVNGVRHYGAKVILFGANYDEAYAHAQEYAGQENLAFIHPFADDEVIAGQGTVALEMLQSVPDLDIIVVPVGGGGLISGMASAVKALNPLIEIVGVTAEGAPAFRDSFYAKAPQSCATVRTIADGIAVRDTSSVTLDYALKLVDRIVSVDDEEIANAILFLLERQKLVVEGAGAAGVAALMHHKIANMAGKRVGVVLSGGNMDVTLLSVIIEKGLIKSYRKMKLTVTLVDRPGSLMELTGLLTRLSANIVHIAYDRTSTTLDYGDANVTIHLETKGEEHQHAIRALLSEHGYLSSEDK